MNTPPSTVRHVAGRAAPWLIAVAVVGYALRINHPVSDWNFTHWLFDWDREFVRRGLVGSVVQLLAPGPERPVVEGLAVGVLLAASAGLLAFGVWATRGWPPRVRFALGALLAACPATLSQLAYDAGRFDQINLLLVLLCLAALLRGGAAAGPAALIVTVVAMLVHEAFLAIHLPVLLVMGLYAARVHGTSRQVMLVPAVAGLLLFALSSAHGSMDSVDQDTLRQEIHASFDLDSIGVEWSTDVLYGTLGPRIERNAAALPRRVLQTRAVTAFLLLIPWFWALWRAVAPLRPLPGLWGAAFVACVASPLGLGLVGSDLFRWWSLTLVNAFLVVFFLLRLHESRDTDTLPALPWIVALVVLGVLAGPVGIDTPLPKPVF